MNSKRRLRRWVYILLPFSLILAFCLTTCELIKGVERTVILTEHVVDSGFTDAFWVDAEDFDEDGDIDIVGTSFSTDTLAWWENTDGKGTYGSRNTITISFTGAVNIYAANLDDDKDIDLLCAARDGDEIAWWENDGNGSFTYHSIDNSLDYAYGVYAADLDGANGLDALCSTHASVADDPEPHGRMAWWKNDGFGSFAIQSDIDSGFSRGISVYAADLDGDEDMDVIQAIYVDDDVKWYENNGDGTSWTVHDIDLNFVSASCVYAEDLDGDDDIDVLGSATDDDEIAWWENNGSGSFGSRQIIDGSFDGARCVIAADMDEDGDMDVLGTAYFTEATAWWRNQDGQGTFGDRQIIKDNFDWACCVCVADIDGDGDEDVIGTARNDNSVIWWEKSLE
jgi:hypothetical protein